MRDSVFMALNISWRGVDMNKVRISEMKTHQKITIELTSGS